jgi:hypothetical protein
MPNRETERELYRRARVARFRGESWKSFWEAHREEIRKAFPEAAQRRDVVHRLQDVVLLGVSGQRVEELPAGVTAT